MVTMSWVFWDYTMLTVLRALFCEIFTGYLSDSMFFLWLLAARFLQAKQIILMVAELNMKT